MVDAARGDVLRVACLNNAAIVRLKECEWQKAAHCSTKALEICARAAA